MWTKVRIGILGAGSIAEHAHAKHYADQDNVEIITISCSKGHLKDLNIHTKYY